MMRMERMSVRLGIASKTFGVKFGIIYRRQWTIANNQIDHPAFHRRGSFSRRV